MLGYWESKRYISRVIQRISTRFQKIKTRIVEFHDYCNKNFVYQSLQKEGAIILSNGFLIWIVFVGLGYLTDFWKLANPLLILPYGIVPWWIVLYVRELKKQ